MAKKNTLSKFKETEREARRTLIMDSAEKVFSNSPFDRVSMREIAEDAGIATSSIYTYFPNQDTLFVEATLRNTNALIDELNSIIGSSDNEHLLEQSINTFIEFISKHDSYFRMMVLFMTQGNLNPEALQKLNEMVRRGLDVFESIFNKIGYEGDSRMLAHFFFASLNGILVTYRKLPGRSEDQVLSHMEQVGKVMCDLILKK
ncbi:MAG TPA: TetR/AcrR family transcriptional regulator [Spirochaetota bacterium]|nr:TetR/AcrR family transcriptional regulator [Spirochaetota bacterium]HPI91004.1 TetR/AcrR family transcriptional regulator [Spirochaetota bacterium]HPR48615.1 TetR/AcrR family transcriptional regulator [Spirochaetota bacterium]